MILLISYKLDMKIRKVIRDKDWHFIMIRGQIIRKITILSL